MLYSIVGIDVDNSLPGRLDARPDHVARLMELKKQGRLIIAGPNPAIDTSDPGDAGSAAVLSWLNSIRCKRPRTGRTRTRIC